MDPKELITAQSLYTLGGAAFAVTLFGNVFHYVMSWNPRWAGLVLAEALALITAGATGRHQPVDWIVAFFQGLQIYATSVGIAAITAKTPRQRSAPAPDSAKTFWTRWY
jgi:hypothetical protein